MLVRVSAANVVSSAACGVDIIASEVASEIGLRRRIVLPFARDLFHETSANDRDVSRSFHFDQVMQAGLRTSGCGAGWPRGADDVTKAFLDEARNGTLSPPRFRPLSANR
jgi:hypothetical protein